MQVIFTNQIDFLKLANRITSIISNEKNLIVQIPKWLRSHAARLALNNAQLEDGSHSLNYWLFSLLPSAGWIGGATNIPPGQLQNFQLYNI